MADGFPYLSPKPPRLRPVSTLLLLLFATCQVTAQNLYAIRENLKLAERVTREGGLIYFKVPLDADGQAISQLEFSAPPESRPLTENPREYAWKADELGGYDSLRITYRLRPSTVTDWTEELVRTAAGKPFAFPPVSDKGTFEPYVLPPLDPDGLAKTEFSTIDRGDTSLSAVNRLIRRLDRRIVTLEDLEKFDPTQPLLEDVYRRRTTPRRKHLLLSLALQYLDLPHRLVSGKIVRYGEVYENELWVEIAVGETFYRVYYGDGVDRSEWGTPLEPDLYLACSYDYRDYTLEVVNAAGMPPIPSVLFTTSKNLILDFWDEKNDALARKDYGRAVSLMDSVLVHLPQSVTAATEKGLVLTEAGRPEEGIRYLQYGLKQAETPEDQSFALVQMAKYQLLQNMGEDAVKMLVRAYQVKPYDTSVFYSDYRFRPLVNEPELLRRLERSLYRFN